MGVPDASLADLFDKVRSWLYWGVGGFSLPSTDFAMDENVCKICSECKLYFTDFCPKFKCRGCGIWLCGSCVRRSGSVTILATAGGMENSCHLEKIIKSCKFCFRKSKRYSEKIYPSDSPRVNPGPLSPCSDGENVCDDMDAKRINGGANGTVEEGEHNLSVKTFTKSSSFTSSSVYISPISVRCFPVRSDEETEDRGGHFFIPSCEYNHDSSDVDTTDVSFRHDRCSYRSCGSSPSDSPSKIKVNLPRVGHPVNHDEARHPNSQNEGPSNQEMEAVLAEHEKVTRDIEHADSSNEDMPILPSEKKVKKQLDFVNSDHMWFPPPAEDEDDDVEDNHFEYDDDDDEIGDSRGVFSSSGDVGKLLLRKKHTEEQKEPLKFVVHSHFRALVSQLLQGEGIKFAMENESEDWLAIISNLAWQAANYVKPDTRKGGSMDPGAYVKVKCIASGKPEQSELVKGVVCTKNIKHKRMTSQYKHPRLLLLGGSLEYQRSSSELASFNTLLEEEINHLKIYLSRIEAHRPNVLLVEKSVSPFAQEYLLAKEISLVLNVKWHLLERIARCTGASITRVDNISSARIGHSELFHLEKVSEELKGANESDKRPSKTLMFFDGCPRRLGCTILLRGSCRDELKKLKHVVQYAVFAAYHLSLETSFLADEGASLPKMMLQSSSTVLEHANLHSLISACPGFVVDVPSEPAVDMPALTGLSLGQCVEASGLLSSAELPPLTPITFPMDDKSDDNSDGCLDGQISLAAVDSDFLMHQDYNFAQSGCPGDVVNSLQAESLQAIVPGEQHLDEPERTAGQLSMEYFSAADSNQSILVNFSSRCVTKGALCERSRLLRIKFYGSFDKPLGRYLREDLFEPASNCASCKEPIEAHVQCYIHQQGSLTINVRPLPSHKLSGHQDGKIWMWHRCLQCPDEDGVPPATRRVVMSDAAWGLSFGKFLELSFSNHATANRIASCGHSLQRDCLRFYGCGNMVAFFHYSSIDILSVRLPPSLLEFDGNSKREWLKKEASELNCRMETMHTDITNALNYVEQKSTLLHNGPSDCRELNKQIFALKNLLAKEKSDYDVLLQLDSEDNSLLVQNRYDILELNNLRNSLLMSSHVWEYRLYSLDSILRSWSSTSEALKDASLHAEMSINLSSMDIKSVHTSAETELNASQNDDVSSSLVIHCEGVSVDREGTMGSESSENVQSPVSNLSDKIDSIWTGMVQQPLKSHHTNLLSDDPHGGTNQGNPVQKLPCKRLMSPARVYSFDSATRLRERLHRSSLPSSHLSTVRSFHCSGDLRAMIGDPMSGLIRTHSQISPREAQQLSSIPSSSPTYISSLSHMAEGARLLLPHPGRNNLMIGVYDDEPTSIIAYALSSKDHDDWVCSNINDLEGSSVNDVGSEEFTASSISPWPSFGSVDLEYMNYGSEDASPRIGSLFYSTKKSIHLRVSFEDDSVTALGKAKFSVICYFAKQFDVLRRKCCSNEVDFVRSLSRCKKWGAQGGKSNVYFAKSMDDRFIVKQVTKTELESFEEFAPHYFKYMTESLNSGSPTCLAKVLGIYQVSVKNLRGGKETKMDLMVMENLFFERNISKIYDLKGSSRSRYNPDTSGANKVHLDMNLLEALRTNPIFLGSNAKRSLERAVWNDTSFLASIDVMDYSLLVGVDDERKELVLGIIDFMRQYTWDKQLETWVKASGILGGPKNTEPTIISPKQYKRRFRKAMTTYFFRVPEQWSS